MTNFSEWHCSFSEKRSQVRDTCSAQVYQDGDSDTLLLYCYLNSNTIGEHFEALSWSWKRKQLAFSSTLVFAWSKPTHHVKPLTGIPHLKSRGIWPNSVYSWRIQFEDNSLQSCSILIWQKIQCIWQLLLRNLVVLWSANFLIPGESLSVILSVVCFTH